MVKEDTIAKVKKLLNLSQSDNEHEANLALQKASELMREHCISEAQVKNYSLKSDVEAVEFENIHFPSNTKRWSQILAADVAKAFGCRIIFTGTRTSQFTTKYVLQVFGTKTDRATVQIMLEYTYNTVNRLVKKEQQRLKREEPWENIKRYSHNFRVGLAVSMGKTLGEITRQNEEEGKEKNTQYGLILYNKKQKVDALFKQTYPKKLKSMSSLTTRGTSNGYDAGKESGKGVRFSRPISNTNTRGGLN